MEKINKSWSEQRAREEEIEKRKKKKKAKWIKFRISKETKWRRMKKGKGGRGKRGEKEEGIQKKTKETLIKADNNEWKYRSEIFFSEKLNTFKKENV